MKIIHDFANIDYVTAFVIVLIYIVVDGLYALYTINVNRHKAFLAASQSFLMHFLLGYGTISYVENYIYIIFISIGSFIGTYFTVKYTKV